MSDNKKIKTISCKCEKCGTTISMITNTEDSINLLKNKQSIKCPTCDNQLNPYMGILIDSVASYNKALLELESAISSTGATLNM